MSGNVTCPASMLKVFGPLASSDIEIPDNPPRRNQFRTRSLTTSGVGLKPRTEKVSRTLTSRNGSALTNSRATRPVGRPAWTCWT